MANPHPDRLPPLHQLILETVAANSGELTRSELAKLLVGSRSTRVAEFEDHPAFGRLTGYGRKAVTLEIDILLQQKFLRLDSANRLAADFNPFWGIEVIAYYDYTK